MVERAVSRLREEILGGELRAGERVHIADAAKRLGISMVPVREALRSLAADGLVHAIPQRGYRVSPVSAEDLEETYRLRLLLDPMATELAVPRMTDADRDELRDALAELQRAHDERDCDLYEAAHRRFHSAVRRPCGSAWLLRFVEVLRDNSLRYQRLPAGRQEDCFQHGVDEHRRIADACLRGDAAAAARLMRDHLQVVLEAVRGPGAPGLEALG
jgi:GntR family carbon starvation induced transcriptional regulator